MQRINLSDRKITVFCDIDGCVFEHTSVDVSSKESFVPKILDGVIEKVLEWEKNGVCIIFTTARKESMRNVTEKQLSDAGIVYDYLIMGITNGKRILINDKKPTGEDTAISINIERNSGLKNINIYA